MAHYAKLNNGIVVQIIVAEETFFDTFVDTSPGEWLAGKDSQIHRPAIGYTYDDALDAFIPPQPYPSWTLNEDTCQWEPPVPMPEEGQYMWDEDTTSWVETTGVTNE
jgi:hypothetical protein